MPSGPSSVPSHSHTLDAFTLSQSRSYFNVNYPLKNISKTPCQCRFSDRNTILSNLTLWSICSTSPRGSLPTLTRPSLTIQPSCSRPRRFLFTTLPIARRREPFRNHRQARQRRRVQMDRAFLVLEATCRLRADKLLRSRGWNDEDTPRADADVTTARGDASRYELPPILLLFFFTHATKLYLDNSSPDPLLQCQETRPACGHCVKTGLKCEYPSMPQITHQVRRQPPMLTRCAMPVAECRNTRLTLY